MATWRHLLRPDWRTLVATTLMLGFLVAAYIQAFAFVDDVPGATKPPLYDTLQPFDFWMPGMMLILPLAVLSVPLGRLGLSPYHRPWSGRCRYSTCTCSLALWSLGTTIGAMDYIAEHGLTGNVLHPQDYGDYVIPRLWPQQRSFIDGRVHLYPLEFVEDYILPQHDEDWESRLAKYDIRYLLLAKDDASWASMIEDARSSAAWKLLYEDVLSVLFERDMR